MFAMFSHTLLNWFTVKISALGKENNLTQRNNHVVALLTQMTVETSEFGKHKSDLMKTDSVEIKILYLCDGPSSITNMVIH